jgi:AcrR family transcriptional regulator
MPSQKSTAATLAPLEPKRQRGRLRVAAILDAGAAVFAEKGYDAATMTEIAARANTAIGSLYRFFPTKDVLAEALLARYSALVDTALDGVAARVADLSPAGLADAFVDLMLGLEEHRGAAIVLVDARSDAADKRAFLRNALRQRIATILMTATGTLPRAKAEIMAVLLLYVLKSLPLFAEEAAREPLIAEARELARLYVARAFDRLP